MTETASPDASRVDTLLVAAARASHEMRLADALAAYQAAAELDPASYEAHLGAARTYTRMRRQHDAQAAIDRCLELAPERFEAHAAQGVLLFLVDDNAAAEEALNCAVTLNPDDAEAYLTLAQIQADSGQFEQVKEQLRLSRERIAALPDESQRHQLEAMAWHVETYWHLVAGENNAALESAQEVVALQEANPYAACLAYSNLGILEARLRHYDQAIGYFERAFEMNPFFYRAGSALGRLLIVRNQPARTAEVLSQVLAVMPEEDAGGNTHYAYAVALRRSGQRAEALEQYRLALQRGVKGGDRLTSYWQVAWLHPIGRNVIIALGLAALAAWIIWGRPDAQSLTLLLVFAVILIMQRTLGARRR
jgi:tetratricopeptide (TPR) repeat protein